MSARPIGRGVTDALRLTLSSGGLTHDAAFRRIDRQQKASDLRDGRRPAGEMRCVDSFRYNIAAWEVARLLGLEAMMPPTVERWYQGSRGVLSWWVNDVFMDEGERKRTALTPPPGRALEVSRQRQRMQVFTELVRDTDRNTGNRLCTRDWPLVMLDCTRAFRLQPALRAPDALRTTDRALLQRLRTLDRDAVARVAGRHLACVEIDALLERRDLIVEWFDALVQQRGAAAVLF